MLPCLEVGAKSIPSWNSQTKYLCSSAYYFTSLLLSDMKPYRKELKRYMISPIYVVRRLTSLCLTVTVDSWSQLSDSLLTFTRAIFTQSSANCIHATLLTVKSLIESVKTQTSNRFVTYICLNYELSDLIGFRATNDKRIIILLSDSTYTIDPIDLSLWLTLNTIWCLCWIIGNLACMYSWYQFEGSNGCVRGW